LHIPPAYKIIHSLLYRGLENAPDGHAGTRNGGQLDGARETLVTLGVIVLQTDLQLDGLEEVPLLLVVGVVEQLLDILAHSGCFRDTQKTSVCDCSARNHQTSNPWDAEITHRL